MNMRVLEERTIRSRSRKRYSLNRKIKEKELRKLLNSVESEQPLCTSAQTQVINSPCQNKIQDFQTNKPSEHHAVKAIENTQTSNAAVREKKNKRRSAAKQAASGNTMTATAPADYQIKTSHTSNIATRIRPRSPHHFNQVSYPNCSPHYANYFGGFHGVQAMQSQLAPRAGVGPFNFPQGNHFGHSYMRPMQTVGGIRFGQMNMQGNEACNGFTAYNNPYGVVWRQN